ncbi:MAG: hypothetical protein PHE83_00215 [Opitutaceae bacterium]|nr:hypothetical protein [Opitutaceae bacterium]
MLKDKVIVRAGAYAPWFKDEKGIYYGQKGSPTLVYISFAKNVAWTAVINKEFHYDGPIPVGAIQAATTVLIAELIAPKAGSVTKQMSCKKDFMNLISWEEVAKATAPNNKLPEPTPGSVTPAADAAGAPAPVAAQR